MEEQDHKNSIDVGPDKPVTSEGISSRSLFLSLISLLEDANIISTLTLWWIGDLLSRGAKRTLEVF